ncbi:MAG: polysaccharide deacetylase family protein [Clostridia bacterium]|nr:polysaccharide deacetylase family protein [Clostridia bacterium]
MKYFVIKKQSIITILKIIVISAICINLSCAAVYAHRNAEPITSVTTESKKVALTVEPLSPAEADLILSVIKSENIKVTFFLSNEFFGSYPENARQIRDDGNCVGILLSGVKKQKRNYINDLISEDIETLAAATGENARFVRFKDNEFDLSVSALVYSLGLTPVQWAADEHAEEFGNGDIISVTDINELENTIKRLKAKGYGFFTLNDIV